MLLKLDFDSLNRGCKLESVRITVHFWKKVCCDQAEKVATALLGLENSGAKIFVIPRSYVDLTECR